MAAFKRQIEDRKEYERPPTILVVMDREADRSTGRDHGAVDPHSKRGAVLVGEPGTAGAAPQPWRRASSGDQSIGGGGSSSGNLSMLVAGVGERR